MSDGLLEDDILKKIVVEKYRPRALLTASEELREVRLKNILLTRNLILEAFRAGSSYGEIDCPICKSKLRYDVRLDGPVYKRVNATCTGAGCIRWME